ncbi:hypothetical protein [Halolamina sp.]|uniref:hypothetical protein n=1 Tax=Halolamina sp. TaxID=1940283 RepID=UPI000ADC77EE
MSAPTPGTHGSTGLDRNHQVALRVADGWASFDKEALFVERDGERVRVAFDNVTELSYRDTDYFLVVLSVVLVGFGLWFVPESPFSLLFSVAGLASLYRLYRHRGEVVVRVTDRPKPLTFHPTDGGAFYDALGAEMDGELLSDRTTFFGD